MWISDVKEERLDVWVSASPSSTPISPNVNFICHQVLPYMRTDDVDNNSVDDG